MATSSYGVTTTGFVRKRLAEIKSDLQTNLASAWGVTISTKANSVIGQEVGVFAAAIDDLWQVAEDTYDAMYPNTADGANLDNSVGFSGITRLDADKTKIYAVCYGTAGTTITSGAQIQDTSSNYYETSAEATISLSSAVTVAVKLASVTSGTTYKITIGGTAYSYTAGSSDTVSTVLAGLAAKLPSTWTYTISDSVLTCKQTDRKSGVAVSVSNLTVKSVGSPIAFYAAETGDLEPEIGTVTTIITQISGWDSVSNESDCTAGRDSETDTKLRQRYASTVEAEGTAMVDSIQANLINNVDGVTVASVYENTSNSADSDGRPAHSIEAVVYGGDGDEIAAMIWKKKAAGIDTYGSTSVSVTDSQGIAHTINFNRPTAVPIYLKATVHEASDTTLAEDAGTTIAADLLAQGEALSVGDDVILQKLAAYCLTNVAGIGYMEMTGSTDGSTYSTTNISISARQLATFSSSNIEVTIAS